MVLRQQAMHNQTGRNVQSFLDLESIHEVAIIMHKRIFIGSSIESKGIAEQLLNTFRAEYECVLWYEDFFSLGNYYYTELIQKIITFDYAIMIGGRDDTVTRISTQSEKIAPRDNIYLEYGLFSGILSPNKVLLLVHESCVIASDLSGMCMPTYADAEQAVSIARAWVDSKQCTEHRALSRKDIGLMPTAGVAVGYYYNFLRPFLDRLSANEFDKDCKLTILIPNYVCDDVVIYKRLLARSKRLKDTIVQNYRILVDPGVADSLQLYDIPSSILTLFKTVNYVFDIPEGNTEDTLRAKMRALDDFYDNLHIMIANDYLAMSMVSLERFDQ